MCDPQSHNRGVCQSKEHDCWFKQAFTGFEGGLPLVAFLNMHIVISPPHIKFGEESFSCQVVD